MRCARLLHHPLAPIVPHLPTAHTPAVLPSRLKTCIQFHANDIPVQPGSTEICHGGQGVGSGAVDDKGKATGCLLHAIEAHDDLLDGSNFVEMRSELGRASGKGQVSDVECARLRQSLALGGGGVVGGAVPIKAGFCRAGEEKGGARRRHTTVD